MDHSPTDAEFGQFLYSIGLVADVQGGDKPVLKFRFYRDAVGKFEKCVETWNSDPKIQFTVQLGDIIDGNDTEVLTEQDMADVLRVVAKSEHPMYHVIGNHCLRYNGGKDRLMEKLGMVKGQSWYKIDNLSPLVKKSGHVFLVLDGTDISLNKWDESDPKSKLAENWLAEHSSEEFPNAVTWNGAISSEQMSWLEEELKEARRAGGKVFLFCHYPILADHMVMAISLLWNAPDVVAMLDAYSDVVVGWFSGHFHHGGAQMPEKGKRSWAHVTVEAVLIAPEQSFGVLDVHQNGAILRGTGSCSSHRWLFPSSS